MYAADSTRAKSFSVILLAFASRRHRGARAHCERCTRARTGDDGWHAERCTVGRSSCASTST
eukprot:6339249-Prymnesium_polylepis.1